MTVYGIGTFPTLAGKNANSPAASLAIATSSVSSMSTLCVVAVDPSVVPVCLTYK
jgi:hypothetical protein